MSLIWSWSISTDHDAFERDVDQHEVSVRSIIGAITFVPLVATTDFTDNGTLFNGALHFGDQQLNSSQSVIADTERHIASIGSISNCFETSLGKVWIQCGNNFNTDIPPW